MRHVFRAFASFLVAICVALPSSAFDVPLSDEAVREAYFLGQRHDASFLAKYIKFLPLPKTGPHISSITFLTPFARFAQFSGNYVGNYSAQKALLEHRGQEEFVLIFVEIQLTDTYGRLIPPPPNWRSRSPEAWVPRPSDFWRDFQVQIYNDGQPLTPYDFHGHPTFGCARRGPCITTGATLEFDFRAESFTSDSATIQVIPPEGDPVSVDFNLIRLR